LVAGFINVSAEGETVIIPAALLKRVFQTLCLAA
jgi:hypothetical protein